MKRREYDISIDFNERQINKVIIDLHYEKKHGESVNDEIILELVQKLDGLKMFPDVLTPPYAYFTEDKMELNGKFYKLVWLLEDDQIYIGVVNAYRR
jgi:hypothetical protein